MNEKKRAEETTFSMQFLDLDIGFSTDNTFLGYIETAEDFKRRREAIIKNNNKRNVHKLRLKHNTNFKFSVVKKIPDINGVNKKKGEQKVFKKNTTFFKNRYYMKERNKNNKAIEIHPQLIISPPIFVRDPLPLKKRSRIRTPKKQKKKVKRIFHKNVFCAILHCKEYTDETCRFIYSLKGIEDILKLPLLKNKKDKYICNSCYFKNLYRYKKTVSILKMNGIKIDKTTISNFIISYSNVIK
jgi:hypothetical protein